MAKTLIVASRVKELCVYGNKPIQKLCASADLTEAITRKVEKMIGEACRRAVENQRSTVMARDF